jgi:hypothetical protein
MTDTSPAAERWSTDAERASWKQEAAAAIIPLADDKAEAFDRYMHSLCADTEPSEPPTYDGMWK